MRALFLVSQLFQFIVATNLKLAEFKDCQADLIMYNNSNNVKSICNNVGKTNVYNHAYFVDDIMMPFPKKHLSTSQRLIKMGKYIVSLISPEKTIPKQIQKLDFNYDVVFLFDPSILNDCIFNVIHKKNPNAVCYRFEEGYGSYLKEWGNKIKKRLKIERIIRKITGTVTIDKYIKRYYFFEPDLVLFKPNYELCSIPKLSRNNTFLIDILNSSFDYQPDQNNYIEKYIFFEDGNAYAYGEEEDLEILREIIKEVGADNIKVKIHPRSKNNRFTNLGVSTSSDSGIPWELIQLNCKMDNKVMFAVLSGSVFSSKIYFDDNTKVIFLYKCVSNKSEDAKNSDFEKHINKFIEIFGKNSVFIPTNKNELIEQIKKLKQID